MTESFRRDAITDKNFYNILDDYERRISELERQAHVTVPGLTRAYHSMNYADAGVALAVTSAAWTPINAYTTANSNNRNITADIANGWLQPAIDGVYTTSFSFNAECDTNNIIIQIAAYINGVAGVVLGEFPAPRAEPFLIAFSRGIIRLAAGQQFGLAMQTVAGSAIITMDTGSFNLVRIDN